MKMAPRGTTSEGGSWSAHRPSAAQQKHPPQGFRFPPPPMCTPAHAYCPAARGAAQGKAAAVLAQGPQLLVHSGGVHLQQAQDSQLEAAL